MFYHLYIKLNNKKEIIKWDECEEDIMEDFIFSFVNNEELVINGNFIMKENIDQIEIKKTDLKLESEIRKRLKEYEIEIDYYQKELEDFYRYGLENYEYPEKPQKITEVGEFKNILSKNIFDDLLKKYKKNNMVEKIEDQCREQKETRDIKKIFISHSSKDVKYAKELIKLFQNFGVEKSEIICTTVSGAKLKVGSENYLDEIKNYIKGCPIFICLFSKNYLVSSMCMCEMGASWITENEKILVLLPNTEFSKISNTVFAKSHAMKLEDQEDMAELMEIIEEKFLLNEIKYRVKKDKLKKFEERISEIINIIVESKSGGKLGLYDEMELLWRKGTPRHGIIEVLSKRYGILPEEVESYLNNF